MIYLSQQTFGRKQIVQTPYSSNQYNSIHDTLQEDTYFGEHEKKNINIKAVPFMLNGVYADVTKHQTTNDSKLLFC
jgi:hypothetical protein